MIEIIVQIPNSILQMQDRLTQATKETMQEQIPIIKSEIINRTRKGNDVDGGGFRAYSEGYKKRRQKLGLQISPVNLTVSGTMLNLQQEIKQDNGDVVGEIKVPGAAEAYARRHDKGLDKMPRRHFMGLNKVQIRKFLDALAIKISKRL